MFSIKVLSKISCTVCKLTNLKNLSRYEHAIGNRYIKQRRQRQPDKKEKSVTIDPNEEILPTALAKKKLVKGWADSFGTLTGYSEKPNLEEMSFKNDENEPDEFTKPFRRLDVVGRKHTPMWYARKIEKLGKEGKVYEAIQVLEKEMLVEDRVSPNKHIFTLLIGILGRVGYTEKAFKLFNQMKKMGIRPIDSTYTALFNCCSNSPSKEDGLQRINKLRDLMKEKEIVPNLITYQAIIKAYARHGEVQAAFRVADEALENGLALASDTFSFLLMACIADKEAGFSLGIKVWRLIRQKKLPFQLFHYNLLLRCARDCEVGNDETFYTLLSPKFQTDRSALTNYLNNKQPLLLNEGIKSTEKEICLNTDIERSGGSLVEPSVDVSSSSESELLLCEEESQFQKFPNILNPKFNVLSLPPSVHIMAPKNPSDRLALLGGVPGVLNHINKDKCAPNIKTFSLLVDLIPNNSDAEENMLKVLKENSVKPDISFFNAFIRRRNLRNDYDGAKDILDLIVSNGLQPDMKTFGCLAMGCKSARTGMALLEDMLKSNKFPSVDICNILTYASYMDFGYKLKIIQFMKKNKIRPDVDLLKKLEKHISLAKRFILASEKNKDQIEDKHKTEKFIRNFEVFMMSYKPWLKEMEIEPEVHPWSPFQQPKPEPEPDL